MFESYYYRKKDEKLLDIYTLEDADECQRTNQIDKKRKCIPFKGMFTRTLWPKNVHDLGKLLKLTQNLLLHIFDRGVETIIICKMSVTRL